MSEREAFEIDDWIYCKKRPFDLRREEHIPYFQIKEISGNDLRATKGKATGVLSSFCRKVSPFEAISYLSLQSWKQKIMSLPTGSRNMGLGFQGTNYPAWILTKTPAHFIAGVDFATKNPSSEIFITEVLRKPLFQKEGLELLSQKKEISKIEIRSQTIFPELKKSELKFKRTLRELEDEVKINLLEGLPRKRISLKIEESLIKTKIDLSLTKV